MSARNTGLFVAGVVEPQRAATLFWEHPAVRGQALPPAEHPRVGHGEHAGKPFTLVSLRLFEEGGVLLLDQAEPPGADDLEQVLGRGLSADGGAAVFLGYDEERGSGGFALFEDGRLVGRRVIDGRGYQPVERDLEGEHPLDVEDEEAWLWEDIGAAVEEGAARVLGEGVRTDDDLAAIIGGVELHAVGPDGDLGGPEHHHATAQRAQPGHEAGRPSTGLRSLLRRLAGREGD